MRKLLLIAVLVFPFAAHAEWCGAPGPGTGGIHGGQQDAINLGARCTPGVNSTIVDFKIATNGTTSGSVIAALYDSDGGGGAPKTLLCTGTLTTAATTGFTTIPVGGCSGYTMTAGHLYWVAHNTNNSGVAIDDCCSSGSGEIFYKVSQACCTFVNLVSPSSNTSLMWQEGMDITPSDVTESQCGQTGMSSNAIPPTNTLKASACVPSSASLVLDCMVYFVNIGSTPGNLNCAIYDSDGTAGAPQTLLCQGTPITPSPYQFLPVTMTGCPTLASGHTYFVAVNADQSATNVGSISGGTTYSASQACCIFSNFGTSSTTGATVSVFLNLGPGATKALRGYVINSQ